MEPHWCEKGHIGYVLEWKLETRFPDETTIYEMGDGIFIWSGAVDRHMARTLTDAVRVVFLEEP